MTNSLSRRALTFSMATALQFLILTTVAMFFYPGGTSYDPSLPRYLFFSNFFSELGLIAAYDGTPNPIGAAMFLTALTAAGLGLIAFFWQLPRLMKPSRVRQALAWLCSLFGLAAGISFIGVAFTPADVLLAPHIQFVFNAFISFFAAATGYALLFFTHPTLPNRLAAVFIFFSLSLGLYLFLLFFGPSMDTAAGITIQATGQKAIGYVAIGVMFVTAWLLKTPAPHTQPDFAIAVATE